MTVAWIAAAPLAAHAQAADPDRMAGVQSLFDQAIAEMSEERYAAACPKLEEVTRRVPEGLGAKLALAGCYEAQGKLASAWSQLEIVEQLAAKAGQTERSREAAARAGALRLRLPMLLIDVPGSASSIPGILVKRDGVLLDAASFGTAIPIDPGRHTVSAEAPGKEPVVRSIQVNEGDTRRVVIGPLIDVVKPEGAAGEAVSPAPSFFTPARISGVTAGALGIAGLAVAAGLAGVAASKKAESNADCDGDTCGPAGLLIRNEARSFGDGATVGLVAGGGLAVTGLVLVLAGGPKAASGNTTGVMPMVSPNAAGVLWKGAF